MRFWMGIGLLVLFIFLALNQGAALENQVKVAVTMPVLGAIVEDIGGEHVQVVSLLPPNVDPHSYEPSVEKVLGSISKASLIVMSGPSHLPLEEKVRRLSEEGVIKTPILDYRDYETMGLLLLSVPGTGAINPHGYFFSFSGQRAIAKACAAKLSRIDPDHAEYYERRLGRYLQRLSALEERIKAMGINGMKVIIGGPDLQYLAEDLDLKILDMIVKAHGIEPSTQEISKIINLIKSGDAAVVIVSDIEVSENSALLGTLKENKIPYIIVPISELMDEPELIPLVTASLLKSNLERQVVGAKATGGFLDMVAVPSLAANLVLFTLMILLLIKVRRYAG
ncbi:MAG: metal ABC transporter substrate-binding protein [Thaumarchaeota archaeon]|nr:metal ABC transporter substrate-binding protein [Nitrososphaerota archaeon]